MRDAERVLVLAPHADDELLGCGGTLALFAAQGVEVRVVVVFDGAAGDPEGRFEEDDYVARREAEACRGGAHLGVAHYDFWGLAEGHAPRDDELLSFVPRLAEAVRNFAPEVVLAPWRGESHADHASVARAVELWLEAAPTTCEVWGYEVWSQLEAELLVDVSSTWKQKLAALAEHETQLSYRDLLAWSTENSARFGESPMEAFKRLDPPRILEPQS